MGPVLANRSKHVVDIGRPDSSNRIVQRLHVDCEENEDLECEVRKNVLTWTPRLENAPFWARGNLRIVVTRSRMLPSVRPLDAAMSRRPAWEFADRVQIKPAYSRYGGADWFSRSRLADCCAMLSFRSPYASAVTARYAAATGTL